jgi:hypothetical protein
VTRPPGSIDIEGSRAVTLQSRARPYGRRIVDTSGSGLTQSINVSRASGMVAVQADCTCAEAVRLMVERGTIAHSTLEEIATGVLARQIRFGE